MFARQFSSPSGGQLSGKLINGDWYLPVYNDFVEPDPLTGVTQRILGKFITLNGNQTRYMNVMLFGTRVF
jgi:hypothetical protein